MSNVDWPWPHRAQEVKEHPFFRHIDWNQVYLQKYTPPLIPPRGEVNAADAFDIGSFDEEDTKGIKLSEGDQDLYRNFPLVVSERWQQEVAETVFDAINTDTDKLEQKKKLKPRIDDVDVGKLKLYDLVDITFTWHVAGHGLKHHYSVVRAFT